MQVFKKLAQNPATIPVTETRIEDKKQNLLMLMPKIYGAVRSVNRLELLC